MAQSELDEASTMASLNRLQEMHVALRHLRETIPRVVGSVILEPALPDLLHAHFKEAATDAAKDIQDFKHLMGHPRNKEVLEKAKESRARDPEKITPWLVTEHEDWLDVKKEDSSDDFDMAGNDEETKTPDIDTKTEDIKVSLDKFEKSHRGITTFIKPEFKSMMVALPSPAKITFAIDFDTSTEGVISYAVGCTAETKLNRAIIDAIASRPQPNDLIFLLVSLD